MSENISSQRPNWRGLLLILIAAVIPAGIHWLFSVEFEAPLLLLPLIFFLVVSLIVSLLDLREEAGRWSFSIPGALAAGLLILGGGLYFVFPATWSAWLFSAALYCLSLAAARLLTAGQNRFWRYAALGMLGLAWAVAQVGAAELEARFSNEEFYTGLEVILLSVQWLLIWAAQRHLRFHLQGASRSETGLKRWPLVIGLATILPLFCAALILQYQRSFYPRQAPQFTGISQERPFICGDTAPSQATFDARANFSALVDLLQANEAKGTPELGLLALLTGDKDWAGRFRESLMREAQAGNYTQPAGSIKYGQYLAAIRIYYYVQTRQAFPDLFSLADQQALLDWFHAINRRAQTVEAVDWLYGLAFRLKPQGPYVNQDIGAGLLALLEANNLGDPALEDDNRAYLDERRRGWQAMFRNIDDSLVYQQVWSENAWFQSQVDPDIRPQFRQQSFDWLLRLALPAGGRFNINPYYPFSLYGAAHLAGSLLQDPSFIWLEGASLQQLQDSGDTAAAYVGLDRVLEGSGSPPQIGSCLLYGNSGVPANPGPLAPDKIVLRNGWETDDLYLLLNLRFTGWHRYKATNSISMLYAGGPLTLENSSGSEIPWLPAGRQQFRDKRIPRENLNALVIPVQGLQAVNRSLAGLRSSWAQDPPFYAAVDQFETGSEGDASLTRIENWHGWEQTRSVRLYPEGVIVVHDQAQGPRSQQASIMWQLFADRVGSQRVSLQGGNLSAEAVFVPVLDFEMISSPTGAVQDLPGTRVELRSRTPGQLDQAAVFLTGEWVGSQVDFDPQARMLTIRGPAGVLRASLEAFNGP